MINTQPAIIWDMDGVLVDSGDPHYEAWRIIAAEELGIDLSRAQFDLLFGWSDPDIVVNLTGASLPPDRLVQVSTRKENLFIALAPGRLKAIPGAHELLRACAAAGWRQAVATSGPRQNLHLVLDTFGLKPYITTCACQEDVEHGKPDPALFRVAAQRLGVPPERCVVIEDSLAGVQAALAAGMACLAVTTTHPAGRLAGADRVVESLLDVTLDDLQALLGSAPRAES